MSVTGIPKLTNAIKFFKQMRDELPERGVDKVMTLEDIFRQRVVDYAPSRVAGLKNSITSGRSSVVLFGGRSGNFYVQTGLPQAFFVEFGTGLFNEFPGATRSKIVKSGRGKYFKASAESFFQGAATNNGPSRGINIPFEPGGIYPRFRTPNTVSPSGNYIYFRQYKGQKANPFFFRVLEEGHDEPVDKFMEIASRFGFS